MATTSPPTTSQVTLPRITITFCTQCKWLLRAAWLQQELLSTFGTTIGEIALVPATGGIFQIRILYRPIGTGGEISAADDDDDAHVKEALIWDRKAEGGFPEAKVLKQRVRDCVEPGRGLGHSDTPSKKPNAETVEGSDGLNGGEQVVAKKVDLAGPVRDNGPANPLAQRTKPGVTKVDGDNVGKECEDCQ